ncbi:MAG: phytanoyl-CoA dioxygenase family protein [Phycisphaeraceae bacterium]|nr:phytanoyl-CoA dioxygenase family protein [Phycisphaeraceae bacterium]
MSDSKNLLTTRQMANFVTDGFLRFDQLVPPEINRAAIREFEEQPWPHSGGYRGEPLSSKWRDSSGVGAMLALPKVRAIIHSLVGPEPRYDHHHVHIVPPRAQQRHLWHADAIIDTRLDFDIQIFYFAHDTPREMGGTMFLPGSHFRQVNESDIARHQNFLGQHPIVCKAGTIVVGHHGVWHCAQSNHTEQTRYMFKVRLNPMVRQLRLWNTDDLDNPEIDGILGRSHGWYGNDDRIEIVQRIKLWRFITGNEKFDAGYWLGRLENKPENVPAAT